MCPFVLLNSTFFRFPFSLSDCSNTSSFPGSSSFSTFFWVVQWLRTSLGLHFFFFIYPKSLCKFIQFHDFMCYLPSTLVYRPNHSLEYQSHISNCFLDLSSFMLVRISSSTFFKTYLDPFLQVIILHTFTPYFSKHIFVLSLPHFSEECTFHSGGSNQSLMSRI